jgi:phosphate transport system protein
MVAVPGNSKLDAELVEINTRLLEMGDEVELMIGNSIKSLIERDSPLAESTVAFEQEINILGQEIDSHCLRLLAYPAPAAQDPRFLTQALKIVIDLERIGNQCAGIARNVLELNLEARLKPCIDLTLMADMAKTSVREALKAFVGANGALAVKVFQGAGSVDGLNDQIQRALLTVMMEDPATIRRAMKINSISKYLETIADHARNIAETVILMAGRDIGPSIA